MRAFGIEPIRKLRERDTQFCRQANLWRHQVRGTQLACSNHSVVDFYKHMERNVTKQPMRIVLGIDGSNESALALDWLRRLPFEHKPEVTLVHAIHSAPAYPPVEFSGLQVNHQSEAERFVAPIQETLSRSFTVQTPVIDTVHPATLLLRVADEVDADMIVVGAAGHNAVYRVVLGSTTEHVARNAKCSVLVVRGDAFPTSRAKLLLAYDGSDSANIAKQALERFAWPNDTESNVLTVLEKPRLIEPSEVYDQASIDAANERLNSLAFDGLSNSKRVTREAYHVGDGILGMAEVEQTDLIVVGATGKSALAEFFLGSVSRHILHHAKCGILICRAAASRTASDHRRIANFELRVEEKG